MNLYSSNEENKGEFNKYFPTDSQDYNSQRWAVQIGTFTPARDPDTDIEEESVKSVLFNTQIFKS